MHKVHWIPNVKSLRIPKILLSCGLSNLLHITVYKYQGSRIYRKDFSFLRIVQSLAFLLYTFNARYLCRIRIYRKDFAFLRIIQSLAYYRIQVSRFPHMSQRFWFPADCPIKVSAYMFAFCNHVYCIQVSRALRSFPHIVGLHFFLTKKGGSIYLRTVKVTAAV